MRRRDILSAARRDGKAAGESAASWAFDGNTSRETYARIIRGFEDGDPEILDSLPWPNLSGEWAGDPTPRSLAEDYGITEERDPSGDLTADACDAWEDAASSAFKRALTAACRAFLCVQGGV